MRGIKILTRKLKGVLTDPMLLGQVVKTSNNEPLKTVKVLKMQLNKSLKMYFNKSYEIKCTDGENLSKQGDIVLIKLIEPQVRPFENYKIQEVVFKVGDTIDPITKEKMNQTSLEAI
jgi:hypothetical protein